MIMKDLFVNLAILVSLLYLFSEVSNKLRVNFKASNRTKIILGVLGGLLSNILMQFGIHVESTIIDLRHIPTILLAYYGGAVPALISMILTIIGRFLISVNLASYLAIVINVPVTILSIYISKGNTSRNVKVLSMLTFNNIIFSIAFVYLITDNSLLVQVLPTYWFVSYLSAYVAFYVISYLRKNQKLFAKYQTESIVDSLTGLNNVRKFDEVFSQLINELKGNEQKLSLLYIDIDFFKQVNDTYGHAEGDTVLKELGSRLKKSTRNFDIVSRNGGEEFSVLLLDCPLKRAIEIAEQIRKNVENNLFILNSGNKISLTVSIGIACYQETTVDPIMLIEDADKALYQAKQTGRNRVCVAAL